MGFFGIGVFEIILILVLSFVIFGPDKMPEIARGLGKAIRTFRKYSTALTKDFTEEINKEVKAPSYTQKESDKRTEETTLGQHKGDQTSIKGNQPQSADE